MNRVIMPSCAGTDFLAGWLPPCAAVSGTTEFFFSYLTITSAFIETRQKEEGSQKRKEEEEGDSRETNSRRKETETKRRK